MEVLDDVITGTDNALEILKVFFSPEFKSWNGMIFAKNVFTLMEFLFFSLNAKSLFFLPQGFAG